MTDDHATADALMLQGFESGDYWTNGARQEAVRSALGGVAERGGGTGAEVIPFPAGTATSLRGDAAKYRAELEALCGNPNSVYWKGSPDRSAALYQQDLRDLIRGDQQGAAGVVGPAHEADVDVPTKGHTYQLDGLPIYSAEDRDIVDSFLRHVRDADWGQQRVTDVLTWALAQPSTPTRREFKAWAVAQGWSDRHVRYALEFYDEQRKTI